jgi:chromosome segregation ATPase
LSDRLLSTVARLKTSHDDLRRTNDKLNAVIAQMRGHCEVSPEADVTGVVQQLNSLKEKCQGQSELVRVKTRKCHELSEQLKSLQKRSENEQVCLTSQIQSLNETIDNLMQRTDELNATNLALRKELQAARASQSDLQAQGEELRVAIVKDYESQLQACREAQDVLEARLREEIRQQQQQYTQCAESLSESTSSMRILKKAIRAQKDTIAERDHTIALLKREFSEAERLLVDRAESEKAHITETFKQAQAELQKQCDGHRSDIQRLAEELAGSERRLKDGKAQILELRREVQRLEKDAHSLDDQMEREKRLHEAALRAAALGAESESAARLNEQKAHTENEKRRILAYVAEAFKQFFNPQEVIDETAFRHVVLRARDELAALVDLNQAVRRIVRASAHQKTEDAVAQAVMGRTWS